MALRYRVECIQKPDRDSTVERITLIGGTECAEILSGSYGPRTKPGSLAGLFRSSPGGFLRP
jgi:hypothetical protein